MVIIPLFSWLLTLTMIIPFSHDFSPWKIPSWSPGHLPMVFRPIGRQHVLVAPRKKRCSMSKWGFKHRKRSVWAHGIFILSIDINIYIYINHRYITIHRVIQLLWRNMRPCKQTMWKISCFSFSVWYFIPLWSAGWCFFFRYLWLILWIIKLTFNDI